MTKKIVHDDSEFVERLSAASFVPDAELDFHDFGPLTPFDVESILLRFLEDSYVGGARNVIVITGKGVKVRPHVGQLLGKNKFVEEFRVAGYFNGQEGAYEVKLRNRLE